MHPSAVLLYLSITNFGAPLQRIERLGFCASKVVEADTYNPQVAYSICVCCCYGLFILDNCAWYILEWCGLIQLYPAMLVIIQKQYQYKCIVGSLTPKGPRRPSACQLINQHLNLSYSSFSKRTFPTDPPGTIVTRTSKKKTIRQPLISHMSHSFGNNAGIPPNGHSLPMRRNLLHCLWAPISTLGIEKCRGYRTKDAKNEPGRTPSIRLIEGWGRYNLRDTMCPPRTKNCIHCKDSAQR